MIKSLKVIYSWNNSMDQLLPEKKKNARKEPRETYRFSPFFNKIIAIGCGEECVVNFDNEKKLLMDSMELLLLPGGFHETLSNKYPTTIEYEAKTHHFLTFGGYMIDVPMLQTRCVVNNVDIPFIDNNKYSNVLDSTRNHVDLKANLYNWDVYSTDDIFRARAYLEGGINGIPFDDYDGDTWDRLDISEDELFVKQYLERWYKTMLKIEEKTRNKLWLDKRSNG